jgi:hypothetical protein
MQLLRLLLLWWIWLCMLLLLLLPLRLRLLLLLSLFLFGLCLHNPTRMLQLYLTWLAVQHVHKRVHEQVINCIAEHC